MTLVAVLTGHLLALDHARRIRARSDGTGTTVLRVAVRVRTAMEAIALHDALEAATLRGAGDLDHLARREDADVDDFAHLVRRDFRVLARRVVETEAAEHGRRRSRPAFFACPTSAFDARRPLRRALTLLLLTRDALRAVAELHRRKALPPPSSITFVTGFGVASTTVQGICCPFSLKIWVIPSFLPMMPIMKFSVSVRVAGSPRFTVGLRRTGGHRCGASCKLQRRCGSPACRAILRDCVTRP